MPDSEKLASVSAEVATEARPKKSKPKRDRDDLSGLVLNMSKNIDPRELFIVWIVFLFLHTEMFAEHFLKRFSGATNEDLSMTMKGTLCASVLMMIVVLICSVVFY
ncbi:hypothetical protein PHYBOEH_005560 [Phytophthora boehmeriae]|uniref:Uncharacterized protein n=1 Tax=Phytophthora boehmeriae TaxID=109152 RepID=A0A8T1WL94_9STRA|nr:hypothetical protein PHYBOEH_005560 [Phytophthora boehmeriae]